MDVVTDKDVSRLDGNQWRFRGFTLLELIISLAVLAILLGVAAPSLGDFLRDQRMTTEVNGLVLALNLTRSTAIKSGIRTVICKSADGDHCTNDGTWSQGWIVFEDRDANHDRDSTEAVVWRGNPESCELNYRGFGSSNYIVYYPIGDVRVNGTFTFCDERGDDAAKAVIIAKPGRIRVSETSASGDPLTCQ